MLHNFIIQKCHHVYCQHNTLILLFPSLLLRVKIPCSKLNVSPVYKPLTRPHPMTNFSLVTVRSLSLNIGLTMQSLKWTVYLNEVEPLTGYFIIIPLRMGQHTQDQGYPGLCSTQQTWSIKILNFPCLCHWIYLDQWSMSQMSHVVPPTLYLFSSFVCVSLSFIPILVYQPVE